MLIKIKEERINSYNENEKKLNEEIKKKDYEIFQLKLKFNSNLQYNISPIKRNKFKEINKEKNSPLNNTLCLIHSKSYSRLKFDSNINLNPEKFIKQYNKKIMRKYLSQKNNGSLKHILNNNCLTKKENEIIHKNSRNISFDKNFSSLRNLSFLQKSKMEESHLNKVESFKLFKKNKNKLNYDRNYKGNSQNQTFTKNENKIKD
jgi:hypothetical protein